MNNQQRRIGALLPPGNVTVEREFARYAPAGVACNYNRMSRPVSANHGVEVPAYDSFRCRITELTAEVPSEDVKAMALERELAVPVVTSNQATLWAALRFLDISADVPAGRLFGHTRRPTKQPAAA